MLVASANGSWQWRCLHLPLPLCQWCSTHAGGQFGCDPLCRLWLGLRWGGNHRWVMPGQGLASRSVLAEGDAAGSTW